MLYIDERAQQEGLPRSVILKEALQVCVLEKLYSMPESDSIIFQGGTCLRLLYGGPRYSEDLDFITTDRDVLPRVFEGLIPQMNAMSPLFEGRIWLRVQKDADRLVRWRVYHQSAETQERALISVEFASYPAYTSSLVPLTFPRGYPAAPLILVNAETEEEILADKITALASRRYPKGRDLFDIWLLKGKGVTVNPDMVRRKLKDYSATVTSIERKTRKFTEEQIALDLENYLPAGYRRRFEAQGYGDLLAVARAVAREAVNAV